MQSLRLLLSLMLPISPTRLGRFSRRSRPELAGQDPNSSKPGTLNPTYTLNPKLASEATSESAVPIA